MKINHKLLNEKCGIYKIYNKKNNKYYIGSSKNLYDRLHIHFCRLRNNKHHNNHLQSSYNKYGYKNYDYDILEFCEEEFQFIREQYYITLLKPEYNKTYNVIANKGFSPSAELRQRISNTLKDKYKKGIISPYNQSHLWENHYIYSIFNFKLVHECKNKKSCLKILNMSGINNINTRIIQNKYIISKIKFDENFDLKNHIYKNYFKDRYNKYLIVIKDNKIYYFNEITELCKFMGKCNSFYHKKVKRCPYYEYKDFKIYYTENYIKLPF